MVQAKSAALRLHTSESPMGMELDGYQWTLFLSGHTERHVKQMREVKSHPDFPLVGKGSISLAPLFNDPSEGE